jgi:hypothetical protein
MKYGFYYFVNANVSFTLHLPYASLHHTVLDFCKYLIVQSNLWQMVHTRSAEEQLLNIPESSARCGQAPRGQAQHGDAPSPTPPRPPVNLEQLLATQN